MRAEQLVDDNRIIVNLAGKCRTGVDINQALPKMVRKRSRGVSLLTIILC